MTTDDTAKKAKERVEGISYAGTQIESYEMAKMSKLKLFRDWKRALERTAQLEKENKELKIDRDQLYEAYVEFMGKGKKVR